MNTRPRTLLNVFVPAAILAGVLSLLVIGHQDEATGELLLAQESIDFHDVPEWEGEVERSILVQNIGDGELRIRRIANNCTYAQVDGPQQLQPGESAELCVKLDPARIPTTVDPGTVVISTDSPKTPRAYLTLHASVKRFAEFSAETCDFGEIFPGTVHQRQVHLLVNAPIDVNQVELMPAPPGLKWLMGARHDSESLLQLRLGPLKEKGLFSSILTASLPNGRTLVLPVVAQVIAPVRAEPAHLFFESITPGSLASEQLVLRGTRPFSLVRVESPTTLRVECLGESPSDEWQLQVRCLPSSTECLLREEIQVWTSIDTEPVRIPVYGVIRTASVPQTTES